eukprot:3309649-Rhodomonas_salina.4
MPAEPRALSAPNTTPHAHPTPRKTRTKHPPTRSHGTTPSPLRAPSPSSAAACGTPRALPPRPPLALPAVGSAAVASPARSQLSPSRPKSPGSGLRKRKVRKPTRIASAFRC